MSIEGTTGITSGGIPLTIIIDRLSRLDDHRISAHCLVCRHSEFLDTAAI